MGFRLEKPAVYKLTPPASPNHEVLTESTGWAWTPLKDLATFMGISSQEVVDRFYRLGYCEGFNWLDENQIIRPDLGDDKHQGIKKPFVVTSNEERIFVNYGWAYDILTLWSEGVRRTRRVYANQIPDYEKASVVVTQKLYGELESYVLALDEGGNLMPAKLLKEGHKRIRK